MKKEQTTKKGTKMNMISREQETCVCGSKLYWQTRESKKCYTCNEILEIEDPKSPIDHLRDEFYEGLNTGVQYEAIDRASRLVADEFAREPEADEIENDEFNEKLEEIERRFDERTQAYKAANAVSQACKNFITAIRTRYVPVAMVKKMTDKLNSRERQLVWSTWKGFSHKVYYPKG